MCYEVHGYAGRYFNLISDACTSVNSFFTSMPGNARLNRMSEIGIYARDSLGDCVQIEISLTNCSGYVDGTELTSMYQSGGVSVRPYPNRWRVSVPNCGSTQLVMWIFCEHNPDRLRFHIARGNNLASTSHGLLGRSKQHTLHQLCFILFFIGQFWNIPITTLMSDGEPFVEIYDTSHANYRLIPAFFAPRTWDHTRAPCYYVGNSQGGPSRSHDQRESVIEGTVPQYETSSLFSTSFDFEMFDESMCTSTPA